MKATQVQGLDNEALIELAHERREDPLIAELADRLQDALMILDWRDAGGRGVQEALVMRLKRTEVLIEKVRSTSYDGWVRQDAAAYFSAPAGEGE